MTGDPGYAADHDHWSNLVELLVRDPRTGNWHHELTPEGQLGHTTWTGQPDAYHVAQALLLPRLPVTSSVAESVVRAVR
jgi:mannose/cellobiose epimerase-like protein (N-acyl-D-glucosamine 2-epimerase family)